MQLRTFFSLLIYVGSYLPLSLILLVQDIDLGILKQGPCPRTLLASLDCVSPLRNTVLSLTVFAICAIGLAATVLVLRKLPTSQRVRIIETKHVPADLLNYVIPYVVSFVSLDYADTSKLLGFIVFFAWIFWITVKSGQILLNPTLAVLGWKLFEVQYSYHGSKDIFVGRMLSRIEIEPGRDYLTEALQDIIVVASDHERDQ